MVNVYFSSLMTLKSFIRRDLGTFDKIRSRLGTFMDGIVPLNKLKKPGHIETHKYAKTLTDFPGI